MGKATREGEPGHLRQCQAVRRRGTRLSTRITPDELAAGGEHQCDAVLVREPDNQYDANAVAVFVDGHKVGYIPRADAEDMAASLDGFASRGQRVCLSAEIGWGDPAIIGVRLDLEHEE